MPANNTHKTSSMDYKAQLDAACGHDNAQWETAKKLYKSAFEGNDVHTAVAGGHVQSTVDECAHTHDAVMQGEDTATFKSKDLTECNACIEVVGLKDTLHLQCKHTYRRACLLNLFISAILETTLFPPRFCKLPIPFDICRIMLLKELIKEFDLKIEELATTNPTYCANADCSKFIYSGNIINDIASCVLCETKTCVQC